jgi:hypothetical protein
LMFLTPTPPAPCRKGVRPSKYGSARPRSCPRPSSHTQSTSSSPSKPPTTFRKHFLWVGLTRGRWRSPPAAADQLGHADGLQASSSRISYSNRESYRIFWILRYWPRAQTPASAVRCPRAAQHQPKELGQRVGIAAAT